MKRIKTRFDLIALAAVVLCTASCAAQNHAPKVGLEKVGLEAINVAPATLEAADAELSKLDELAPQIGDTPQFREIARRLRDNVDKLNGLVARVDVGADHAVLFFQNASGPVSVAERRPQEAESALEPLTGDRPSAVEIYRRLAPGRQVPDALLDAQQPAESQRHEAIEPKEPSKDEVSHDPSASSPASLSSSASSVATAELTEADGKWFRDNVCPHSGNLQFCYPNWWNGGWIQGSYKHSRFRVALFSGDLIIVYLKYNGDLKAVLPVFKGELSYYYQDSPWYWDCCAICACGTIDYDIGTHRWEIKYASGDGFHWGGNMFN